MKMVYDVSSLSKDPRTKIGAVLTQENDPISCGFNNFPRKVQDLRSRYENKDIKYSLIVHGENNAILNAAREGKKTIGATIYTQGIPCAECAKAIINAGIKKVIVHKQWPNLIHSPKWVESIKLSKLMFKETGVKVEWLNKILNREGFLDGKIVKV